MKNANNYNIWRNLKDIFPHPYTTREAYDWVKIAQKSSEILAIVVDNKAIGGISILLKDDIYRIYAGVFEYNSMRVLEKAGFHQETILKQSLFK